MSGVQTVGWQSSGNTRGTFDIIWGCLSVLLVCTYTAVHLNLPSPKEREAKFPEVLWFSAGVRQIKWMLIVAIAPEIAVAMAIEDWANARRSQRKMMNEQLEHDWTLTQSFFVGMGGIAIKFENDDEAFPLYGWQVTKLRRDSFRPILQDRLTGMVLLGNEPFLHRLDPHILTKEEIEDKIKANILVKALTVTQASWIVVQTSARGVQNLPISQLELATCAFVFCTVIMYYFWWHKPYGITKPIEIKITSEYSDHRPRQAVIDFLRDSTSKYYGKIAWKRQFETRRISNGKYVSSDVRWRLFLEMPLPLWWSFGLGMIFSSFHILAWNWDFPNDIERLLWRTASSASVFSCAMIGLSLFVAAHMSVERRESLSGPLLGTYLLFFIGIYTVARLIIIVQMFACFRKAPIGLYQDVSFTKYLPHFW